MKQQKNSRLKSFLNSLGSTNPPMNQQGSPDQDQNGSDFGSSRVPPSTIYEYSVSEIPLTIPLQSRFRSLSNTERPPPAPSKTRSRPSYRIHRLSAHTSAPSERFRTGERDSPPNNDSVYILRDGRRGRQTYPSPASLSETAFEGSDENNYPSALNRNRALYDHERPYGEYYDSDARGSSYRLYTDQASSRSR